MELKSSGTVDALNQVITPAHGKIILWGDRQEVHDAVLGVGFRVLGVKVWFLEEVII